MPAFPPTMPTKVARVNNYVPVAANSNAAAGILGAAGAVSDLLERLILVFDTVNPGDVSIVDGTGGGAVTMKVFDGGTASITDKRAYTIDLGIRSRVGGWAVVTGADVSVIAVGLFSTDLDDG